MTTRLMTTAAAIGSLALLVCTAARAEDAASVFARFKAATGGAHWDGVRTLHETGALGAGGLTGTFEAAQDARNGRSSSSFKIGPVDGASGFDGQVSWNRSPGGEVAVLDDASAIRNARSQAWLDAQGYWKPQTLPATFGKVESRTLEAKTYNVVIATPAGGNPLTLWFASDSGLLARTQQPQDGYVVTTTLDDYRAVDGVRLPFHSAIDQTDAAGRTDPRSHQDIRYSHVELNAPIVDAAFAPPKMAATAHIDDPSGITHVPFDLLNNHIYVDGFVDGKPARFMVDTGGTNLLTPAAAAKLGLAALGKMAASGAGETSVDLAIARAKQVRVGAATLDSPVFYVIDLGNLPQIEGAPLDGLVGYEMFRRFGVQIDYAKHELTLSEPKAFAPPAGATVLPFTLNGSIPMIAGSLDGLPVKLSVDTGSRESLTMSSPFVKAHDLIAKYRAAPEAVMGWGLGGASNGRPARLGTLQLGGLAVDG
ncbi:MAG: pepsin/retropepsin-like aspartic protease family protein, partial [Lysobacteraceae bacterium]